MNKTIYGHRLKDISQSEMILVDQMNDCYEQGKDNLILKEKMKYCLLRLNQFKDKVNKLLDDVHKFIPDDPFSDNPHKSEPGSWP